MRSRTRAQRAPRGGGGHSTKPRRSACSRGGRGRRWDKAGGFHRDQGRRADPHSKQRQAESSSRRSRIGSSKRTVDQRPEPRADSLQCRVTQPHVGQWIPSPMPPGDRRVHRGWNTFGRAYPRGTLRRHPRAVRGVEGAPDAPARYDGESVDHDRGDRAMCRDERWVFSFRYTRRGQTNHWDRTGGTAIEIKRETAWAGPGRRLGEHNERIEWIEVAVELSGGADLDEARDEAGERADAEFRRHHPRAALSG